VWLLSQQCTSSSSSTSPNLLLMCPDQRAVLTPTTRATTIRDGNGKLSPQEVSQALVKAGEAGTPAHPLPPWLALLSCVRVQS
jgi:hypothetical protein